MVVDCVMRGSIWLRRYLKPISDEEYARRAKDELDWIMPRRPWLITAYLLVAAAWTATILVAVHFAVELFRPGPNGGIFGLDIAAYIMAFTMGLLIGGSCFKLVHITVVARSFLRHWRLTLRYHDALVWLASQENDEPSISSQAAAVLKLERDGHQPGRATGAEPKWMRWLPRSLRSTGDQECVRRVKKNLEGLERQRRWFIALWVVACFGWAACAIWFTQLATTGFIAVEGKFGLNLLAYVLGIVAGAAVCGLSFGIVHRFAKVTYLVQDLRILVRYHEAMERLAARSEIPAPPTRR
jgi:hypothetical protein